MNTKVFSGEPLPIAPRPENPERGAFDQKILDYLRRLTAKLAEAVNGGGGGGDSTQSYVAKLLGDQTVTLFDNAGPPNAVPFVVKWEKTLHFNSEFFTHDDATNPSEITIVVDGVYQFEFDVIHNDDKSSLDFWIDLKVGGTWYRVSYSFLVTIVQSIAPFVTFNMSVGIPILAGVKCRIRGMPGVVYGAVANGTCDLFGKGTRLSIIRIGDVSDGGTGGGLGWDGNPPSWTEATP